MASGTIRKDVAVRAAKDRVAKALAAHLEPDPKDVEMLEQSTQQEALQPPAPQPVQKASPPPQLQLQVPSTEQQHSQSTTHQSEGVSHGNDAKPKRRSAKEQEWYEFFDQRFGPLVVLLLWLFTTKLERAVFYAPTPAECHELAPHLSRIGVKLEDLVSVPRWVHTAIVTSDDTVAVGMIMMGYLDRIGVLDKIAPWFTGAAGKMRNGVEQAHSDAGLGSVPTPEERAAESLRTNGYRGNKPIDISTVRGLGAQYAPG